MLLSLLETGLCDPNIRDRNGCTPLHFAAQLGKETAVTLLLVNTKKNYEGRDENANREKVNSCYKNRKFLDTNLNLALAFH